MSSYEDFVRNKKGYAQSKADFVFMTLGDFLNEYHESLTETYDLEEYDLELDSEHLQILCLVDISEDKISTMSPSMKRKYRMAGKTRRRKLKSKYHYTNPFNRIHAYAIIENNPGSTDNTFAINVICSSNYSDQKGLGSFLLQNIISAAKTSKYDNIVLEVGNNDAESPYDSEEESEEESDSDEEGESNEESDEEEEDYEELIDIVALNLWKKSIRHNDGDPYYSIDEEYIQTCVSDYLYDYEYEEEEEEEGEEEDYDERIGEEYIYGGYYYTVGKRNSMSLYNYYEKFGFREDQKINTEWKCFGDVPFPSMILKL